MNLPTKITFSRIIIVVLLFVTLFVLSLIPGINNFTVFGPDNAPVTIIYLIARRVISFKDAMECIPKGFNAMVPAILILTMATTLKNTTSLLNSSAFVENALAQPAMIYSLPGVMLTV